MNRLSLFLLAVTVAATGGPARAQQTDMTGPGVVEEDYLVFFENQPGQYFHRAQIDYLDGYRWSCAAEIRKAAAQLRMEAENSDRDEGRQQLLDMSYALGWLADDVERGYVDSVARLDHAFVRAHRVLADHDMKMATEMCKRNDRLATGRYLDAAINNFENGLAWAGHELSDGDLTNINRGTDVADQLVLGERVDDARIKQALDEVGQAVGTLDNIVTAAKWEAPTRFAGTYPAVGTSEVWFFFLDEPNEEFTDAQREMLERNYMIAARDVRQGAAFLRLKASDAKGAIRDALTNNAEALDSLAYNVERDKASVQDLRQAFARAHLALSRYYSSMAAACETKKDHADMGRYLQAAATQLDRAAIWSGQAIESSADAIVRETRTLAGKLNDGADWTSDQVASGMAALDKEIDKLSKSIGQPKKKVAAGSTGSTR
jgi:hypothetical protein